MEYERKLIDSRTYFEYDDIRGVLKEYRAKNPENIYSRNNHNRFFAKRIQGADDIDIGELLGSIIGKNMGFKVCDTELYKVPLYRK